MENKAQGAARLARDLQQRNGAYTLKATMFPGIPRSIGGLWQFPIEDNFSG
jgi:hypothetical protein